VLLSCFVWFHCQLVDCQFVSVFLISLHRIGNVSMGGAARAGGFLSVLIYVQLRLDGLVLLLAPSQLEQVWRRTPTAEVRGTLHAQVGGHVAVVGRLHFHRRGTAEGRGRLLLAVHLLPQQRDVFDVLQLARISEEPMQQGEKNSLGFVFQPSDSFSSLISNFYLLKISKKWTQKLKT